MDNQKITMEVSESSEAIEAVAANEFDLESFKLGEDPVFPAELQDENIGKKSFLIVMSTMPVEFHRLTSSSMLGKTFPKVWIRTYSLGDDESFAKSSEYAFSDARPASFQLKSHLGGGSSGYVTFTYQKAEING